MTFLVRYYTHLKDLLPLLTTGGSWDHKGAIDAMTGGNSWLRMPGGTRVRMDIMSNIHYGYVFAYSGISLDSTLDYANSRFNTVEQIGLDILGVDPGVGDTGVVDDWAITLGYQLCKCPEGEGDVAPPSSEVITEAILNDIDSLADLGGVCNVGDLCQARSAWD
jgi:hypothetical protein